MSAVSRVFVARLAGLPVVGPDGESIGRVRDAVIGLRSDRKAPRVLGLAVELANRRRIFVPILRVTSIEAAAVTLNTGSVSLRRLHLRPGEALVLGQVLGTRVRVDEPGESYDGADASVVDVGIEQTRTRDWVVHRLAVRVRGRGLGRRGGVHVVDLSHVTGFTTTAITRTDQDVAEALTMYDDMRATDVAQALRELPTDRMLAIAAAFDDERLADVLQELGTDDQTEVIAHLSKARAADVLEAMDPDDAADLLGELPVRQREELLTVMDPEDSGTVRRLLTFSPYTAGGMMTPEPIVVTPSTTVAEALARARNPDITPALASMVFVVRPPTATPTGRYIGAVHLQKLLREPPADLVGGIVDTDLPKLSPDDPLGDVTRYFAAYNLVAGPVIDAENHMLGAVSVDDLLDHLLPEDWRDEDENRVEEAR
ncbi:MgtE intracellular region OS=Tsukamurella paurometabola (strain ATCC 8368 / DSM / CCUG 35730/ CIP 100753 / JCM 10117 / KCTC 9821 / NBRC 16120 / NCIMB 702349/ NCTC 13040) OX=521096 GN=Tpau_1195 PE=4 SV=1 [Tsukamurella paurometabola]|uniref:MgtE intracellular region n=1 Tax=Tsukamurella paurometabola (strain ATCC 8368 / DSM 20162 / CCUG 35730 / CIP 100753 / JCM 10117 / KCTC 9821 / NBRC 16120 / NCIMB 702349 / NCTC 13040) TaxID=521096 RepID=D5UW19_TSUPD|nr:CBS domain-containing protein [Tsukamurella paurometabola]ADG77826.1 MgtE intracellular region [Tsukamurella paurometabola DSM 20162]SUP28912.1 Magnesium transporter mgtE [Tsukamurella paurometabola]